MENSQKRRAQMIIFICSPMGSGKTLSLTLIGWLCRNSGYTIFSNYKVNFPHIPVTQPRDIEDIMNGVFLGDELWSWMDARESMTTKNRIVTKILMKSRKKGYHIIHTAQFKSQPDKRLYRHTDVVIVTEHNDMFETCKLKFYDYQGDNTLNTKPKKEVVFNARPIYGLYNTAEEIYDIKALPGDSQ